MTNDYEFKYYDKATGIDINPMTYAKHCIEPVGQLKVKENGKWYAAVVPLQEIDVKYPYRKTLKQRLLRQKHDYYTIRHLDLDRAHRQLEESARGNPFAHTSTTNESETIEEDTK